MTATTAFLVAFGLVAMFVAGALISGEHGLVLLLALGWWGIPSLLVGLPLATVLIRWIWRGTASDRRKLAERTGVSREALVANLASTKTPDATWTHIAILQIETVATTRQGQRADPKRSRPKR